MARGGHAVNLRVRRHRRRAERETRRSDGSETRAARETVRETGGDETRRAREGFEQPGEPGVSQQRRHAAARLEGPGVQDEPRLSEDAAEVRRAVAQAEGELQLA